MCIHFKVRIAYNLYEVIEMNVESQAKVEGTNLFCNNQTQFVTTYPVKLYFYRKAIMRKADTRDIHPFYFYKRVLQ